MRGTIVRRGQKFYAVLDLPPGENGKRRQKWLSGFDTRRDAEAALAETLTEVHTGRYVEPTTMTVRQFLCDEWLPASTARVRATTLRGYRQAIYSYAVPALGDVPLADVTPVGLTKLYGRLLTSGRANGKGGLSARTVRLLHTILRRAFTDAVRWRYLTSNPADGATPPSAAAARAPEMRTWTLAELQAFLRFTADDEYHVGYVLAACCGLRRGEVSVAARQQEVEFGSRRGTPARVMSRTQQDAKQKAQAFARKNSRTCKFQGVCKDGDHYHVDVYNGKGARVAVIHYRWHNHVA